MLRVSLKDLSTYKICAGPVSLLNKSLSPCFRAQRPHPHPRTTSTSRTASASTTNPHVFIHRRPVTIMPPTYPSLSQHVSLSTPHFLQPRRGGAPGNVNGGSPPLDTGVVVGIILGCVLAFAIVAGFGVRHWSKKRKEDERKREQEQRWWREDGMR